MTGAAQEALSREELDAILSADTGDTGARRRGGQHPLHSAALSRALGEFAVTQGRQLAAQYQRPLHLELLSLERVSSEDFAGTTIARDQVVPMRLDPEGLRGGLLIGRSLFFGWLAMALGAPEGDPVLVPDRANSSIERRFMALLARELARSLERALAGLRPVRIALENPVDPAEFHAGAESRLWVASFDTGGLGDVARLRLALPAPWVELVERGDAAPGAADPSRSLESQIENVPVELRAEVGRAELSLRAIAELQVGDTLPLEAVEGGQLLVRIGEQPKFVAVPGSVGPRLAIQLVSEV